MHRILIIKARPKPWTPKNKLLDRYAKEKGQFEYEGRISTHKDTLRFDSLRSNFITNNVTRLRDNCSMRHYGYTETSDNLQDEYAKFKNTHEDIYYWKIDTLYKINR